MTNKPVKVEKWSFNEMIADVKKKNEEAFKKHKESGGVCQNCGKHKAEYPNGLHPFNCKKCNEEAKAVIKELSKDPGFAMFRV
jgi:hypothetical protein